MADWTDGIVDACDRARRNMLLMKARLGEQVVVADAAGKPLWRWAKDVYEESYGPLPPLPR